MPKSCPGCDASESNTVCTIYHYGTAVPCYGWDMNNKREWYQFMNGFTDVLAVGLLIMYLFGGCAYGIIPEHKPGQDEAVQATLDFYGGGLLAKDLPVIVWHNADEMNCDGDPDGVQTGWVSDGICVAGLFMTDSLLLGPAWFELAWWKGVTKFSQIQLTHELCHYWKYKTTGDPDSEHQSDCFLGAADVQHANPNSLSEKARLNLAILDL